MALVCETDDGVDDRFADRNCHTIFSAVHVEEAWLGNLRFAGVVEVATRLSVPGLIRCRRLRRHGLLPTPSPPHAPHCLSSSLLPLVLDQLSSTPPSTPPFTCVAAPPAFTHLQLASEAARARKKGAGPSQLQLQPRPVRRQRSRLGPARRAAVSPARRSLAALLPSLGL